MINYQGEDFTETEFYGREILEAIQLTNKFPTPKKVLIDMLEEMIHEQLDLIDKEELNNLRKLGSMLQGHPDMKKIPGVEMSTGSLGQGFSVACGMAMAAKLDNAPWNVYALLGDGEVQEGIIWEAAMSAAHYKLDNMIAFLDYNGLQIDGEVESVMSINPIEDKFRTFGWNVITIDGHDFDQIFAALDMAKDTVDKPTMIIAKTVKGKGVSFMENQASWHGSAPSEEQLEQALSELGGAFHE